MAESVLAGRNFVSGICKLVKNLKPIKNCNFYQPCVGHRDQRHYVCSENSLYCSSIVYIHLSFVGLVHSVGEERPEVGTTSGHDGSMHGKVAVFDANHSVAELTVLAQII